MPIIKRLCHNKGLEIVEGAVCVDHVHISLRIPPKLSVAEVGLPEREGRAAAVRREPGPETSDWSGQDVVGAWVLCQHGRAGRVRDPAVHEGAGRGRPVRRRVT